ncbi:MAG: hypothetical protein UX65_C0005G0014 [Parcubacteria group bacterium GW2011_GWB1_46_8]|nr:MAG: hypothetical protein UX14_C0028G0009 [Parcubacteria group bacterium GW2011_GWF1_45_5]KKU11288.1 MAG: hypothetical protein UX15_C0011G0012 [Parcubacteria group bacterium GW2011_GWA1_45_7]KKU46308.1 MAG: hypothetical protein UX65_C0005G0014 [Parcubacteria group bacterium GW2011_GWB1_46_8]
MILFFGGPMPTKNLKSSDLPVGRGFWGNSARPTNFGRNLFEFFRTHTASHQYAKGSAAADPFLFGCLT